MRFLDHTADVGMDVDAPSLESLLHRCALGMLALLRGEDDADEHVARPHGDAPGADAETSPVEVRAEGPAGLLAGWLRELLYLHGVRQLDYVSAQLDRATPTEAHGRILVRPGGHAVREIKGVTYHELQAIQRPNGRWYARVIFDV